MADPKYSTYRSQGKQMAGVRLPFVNTCCVETMRVCNKKRLVLFLWMCVAPDMLLARQHALIVCNAAYDPLWDLANTHQDADAYALAFRQMGYAVSQVQDQDLDSLADRFDAFLATIGPGDEVAFVYSGHGWSDGSWNDQCVAQPWPGVTDRTAFSTHWSTQALHGSSQ
ncbi:MAG: caspase family protein [Rhodobacteraceae bacterium]|nr:caspase family protein [Paracoccaceae bacterium]